MPVLVSLPFGHSRDGVINSALELMDLAEQELDKIMNHPDFLDEEKEHLKNKLANLHKLMGQLGERRGIWPKFIYVNMKNPNQLAKEAQGFLNSVKLTSKSLATKARISQLSTPTPAPTAMTVDSSDELMTPKQSTYEDIITTDLPPLIVSSEDAMLSDVMHTFGGDLDEARAVALTGDTTLSVLRNEAVHGDIIYASAAPSRFDRLAEANAPIGATMSTTNEFNSSEEQPEKSVAELFRSAWNHSQTSFGGSSHEDGNFCDVGAVYDYSQAVREYKASPLDDTWGGSWADSGQGYTISDEK